MNFETENNSPGFAEIVKNIGSSGKDLIKHEVELLKAEFFSTLEKVSGDLRNTIVFGGLFILGAIPFILFLVIAIGDMLHGNYAVSSLIVAILWSALCIFTALYYYRRLTKHTLDLSKTQQKTKEAAQTINAKVQEVKDAVDGAPEI